MSFTCVMIHFFNINNYDSFLLLYCSKEVMSYLYILEIFNRNLKLDDKKLFIQQVEYKKNNTRLLTVNANHAKIGSINKLLNTIYFKEV